MSLIIDPGLFATHFNKRHFEIQHRLAAHPLFEIPRLLQLAREMAADRPGDIYYDAGVTNIGSRWGTSPAEFPVDQTIERLETAGAWIDLKAAERSAPYAQVLNNCISDLLQVSGRELERKMRRKEMAIFLTSPNRLSTYHMDSECNFLLQLRGEKNISIFPKDDREVLPEEEIERFWAADTNAAIYKPHLQHRASVIRLKPGTGVHIPVNAPHWVQNDNNISVTVAILYHSWHQEYLDLYAANYCLRKMRVSPKPPFQSRWRDSIKRPIGAAALRLLTLRRGGHLRDVAGNAAGVHDVSPP
ncbi:MAG: cupin-like domain-containing protein [Proteobacteria bacterium]|nr:cupin-like domain-containing protein [Pseudomonadota bacterium]